METVLIVVNYNIMIEGTQIERENFWSLEPQENKTFKLKVKLIMPKLTKFNVKVKLGLKINLSRYNWKRLCFKG